MANEIEIKVPDIGGSTHVDVIEILVKVGQELSIDSPLITLESDKASMEIPSPKAGKVTKLLVKIGDKVSEGDAILMMAADHASEESSKENASKIEKEAQSEQATTEVVSEAGAAATPSAHSQIVEVSVPDIGGSTDVDVIDIMVKSGTKVEKEQSLITLEGDKATMDIPSPYAGLVKEVTIKLGDKVSQGHVILTLETTNALEKTSLSDENTTKSTFTEEAVAQKVSVEEPLKSPIPPETPSTDQTGSPGIIAAGPAVRRMARELGVHLNLVHGSGRKSRVTKEDIQAYVKKQLNEKQNTNGFSVPGNPIIDFSKFGDIEIKPLNKIKKITGINVHRSWITIPHVTQFDEADITELEAFRKCESENLNNSSYKLTILAFVCRVVSKALQIYPQFNSSLDAAGENLIYKKYCNLGIAVETPNGLVVPVIKNVEKLNIGEIAQEMAKLSSKARDKGLMPAEMSGGCFTISSLGGIGGTAFTPIVNSPEVAILGLSRATMKPVYDNGTFKPRLMLPLSLSYDHRVIDGAEAARFTRFISEALSDIRKILL